MIGAALLLATVATALGYVSFRRQASVIEKLQEEARERSQELEKAKRDLANERDRKRLEGVSDEDALHIFNKPSNH